MSSEFKEFTSKNYADQGKAFLNAYWNEHQKDAELIWTWAHKFGELDLEKKAEGNDLDEFNAHRFLESLQETKTVRQMRTEIKESDLDFNKRLALIEYCIWKYKRSVQDFLKRPQGDNQEELLKAQAMLDEVSAAFRVVEERAKVAKAREAEAVTAEKPFKEAQEELNAAIAELKAQEDAYKRKTEDLKQRSETGGAVSRNKAKAELEIHVREDPLPLRKAKISTEAAERKADKARAPFKIARERAEEARRNADEALDDATKKLKEAEDYLEEVRKKPGQPYGSLWWIDRELEEKRKYLPSSRRK